MSTGTAISSVSIGNELHDTDQTTYLAALPLKEDRALNEQEIAEIHALQKKWRLVANAQIFLMISAVSIMAKNGLAAAALAAIAQIPLWAIASAPSRRLKRALEDNRIQVFRADTASSRVVSRKNFWLDIFQPDVKQIKLLPEANLVLPRPHQPDFQLVFKTSKPVESSAVPANRQNKRLTEQERTELKKLSKKYAARACMLLPLVPIWLALILNLQPNGLDLGRIPEPLNWLAAAFYVLALFKLSPYQLIKLLLFAGKLGEDLNRGTVTTNDKGQEFLPYSGQLWSKKGQPAKWRVINPPLFSVELPMAGQNQPVVGERP